MKTSWVTTLLVAGISFAAQAQTGRIAHFGHGGSVATLAAAEAKDNFGLPSTEYQNVRISPLSDSTALVEGQERYVGGQQWRPFKATFQISTRSKQASELRYYRSAEGYTVDIWSLESLQQLYSGAKLMGFDKAKPKSRRKSSVEPGFWVPLPPYSGFGIVGIVLLAGAGWLLAAKPKISYTL